MPRTDGSVKQGNVAGVGGYRRGRQLGSWRCSFAACCRDWEDEATDVDPYAQPLVLFGSFQLRLRLCAEIPIGRYMNCGGAHKCMS